MLWPLCWQTIRTGVFAGTKVTYVQLVLGCWTTEWKQSRIVTPLPPVLAGYQLAWAGDAEMAIVAPARLRVSASADAIRRMLTSPLMTRSLLLVGPAA